MSDKRLYFFDNAKYILIVLVLVGHFFEVILDQNELAKSLYILIYTFHMPAFIFIAGYFSNINYNLKNYLLKIFKELLIPYFIFQLLYQSFDALLNDFNLSLNFKKPYWILWFLLSLFFWRLLIYFIEKLNIKPFLIISVIVTAAFLIGFLDKFGRIYSASRTVVFFPFFIFGYYIKKYSKINKFKKYLNKFSIKFVYLIFLLEIILIYFYLNDLNLEILYGSSGYINNDLSHDLSLLNRFIFLLTASINMFLFFNIVPKMRIKISSLGARSIYPYLLHGFIVIFLKKYDLFYFIKSDSKLIIYFLLAVFLSWLLAAKKIRNIFKYIVEF